MSQIPPEIESLIWSIAESGDEQAINEFQGRFPQYRLELMKRVNAVTNLKKARLAAAAAPVFSPQEIRPTFPKRPVAFAVAAVALSALAFGSYWTSRKHNPPAATSPGSSVDRECLPGEKRAGLDPVVSRSIVETPPVSTPPTNPVPMTTVPRLPKPQERPLTLHLERADLLTVLQGLADRAGWSLTIVPGVLNPEVKVDYDETPIVEIVKDLGTRYGFAALDEGQGKVIVVPVTQNGPMNENSLLQEPQPSKNPEERGQDSVNKGQG